MALKDTTRDCNLHCMAATEVDFSPMQKQSGNHTIVCYCTFLVNFLSLFWHVFVSLVTMRFCTINKIL